jgi:hypothetical protein
VSRFDHFIVTRFNVKGRNWVEDKNKSSSLTDSWLEHRIHLFRKYCLPSVTAQSNPDFTWLIYLSSDTPDQFRKEIEEMVVPFPRIKISYVDTQEEFITAYPDDIRRIRDKEKKFVITTRIDNDDAVHRDMIARIQQSFADQDYMAINFLKIFCLKIEGRIKLYLDLSFSNHFISLIERVDNKVMNGCYSRNDTQWNQPGSVIQITDKVYCVELIHSRNLYNDIKGFPVFYCKDLSAFSLSEFAGYYGIHFRDFFIWKMPWRKLMKSLLKV